MGKRKRRSASDISIPPLSTPSSPPPDDTPCSTGMSSSSSKKSARDANASLKKKLQSSPKDTPMVDNVVKQSNSQISLSHHHNHNHHRQNQGRAAFLKRSRYHGAHHHFPRHHNPADYSGNNRMYHKNNKRAILPDQNQKLSFKTGGKWNTEWRSSSEGIEKLMYQTERITASTSSAVDISSSAVCVLCQDLLRHNPELLYARNRGMIIRDMCMVAVLVCGHVFHAVCLEKRTQARDARDPPCPMCSGCIEKVQET